LVAAWPAVDDNNLTDEGRLTILKKCISSFISVKKNVNEEMVLLF
jgi:hypothetical protein